MKISILFVLLSALICAGCTTAQPATEQTSTTQKQVAPETVAHSMTVTDEKDFLAKMIPHHFEAIDTSKIVEAQTTDPQLKLFTQSVIKTQSDEIVQMKNWLQEWYNGDYVEPSYMPMMGDLTVLSGKELELAYIQGMITHHQGAIEMANQVLTMNPRSEVKQMAENIIMVQRVEVEVLKNWLTTKFDASQSLPDTDHNMMGH